MIPHRPVLARRPTLASSCARAATAAEARFRISHPGQSRPRDSRVIALDEQAGALARQLAAREWRGGHFLTFESAAQAGGSGPADVERWLRRADGTRAQLSEELSGADVVVMLAGTRASAEAATVIGDACAARGIMSAALVLPGGAVGDEVVSALRPNAMVLLIPRNVGDVAEILSALRV